MLHKMCYSIGCVFMVIREDWGFVVKNVKDQCTSVMEGLIKEFEMCFPTHDLMNGIRMIYP